MQVSDTMSIQEGLEQEERKAYGTGSILVKIWFHQEYLHIADFVQRFQSINEAKAACQFLHEMKGIAACYIVSVSPRYKLIERVIKFK